MCAEVLFLNEYRSQREKKRSLQGLYNCSYGELLIEFSTCFTMLKKDPFDNELALWVDDIAEAVAIRCSSVEALGVVDHYLQKGCAQLFKLV